MVFCYAWTWKQSLSDTESLGNTTESIDTCETKLYPRVIAYCLCQEWDDIQWLN